MKWLIANLASIMILLVIVGVVALIIVKIINDKRKGRSSCSCGCGGCAMKGTCHSAKQTAESEDKTEYISINIE